jgi:hypothetical protein
MAASTLSGLTDALHQWVDWTTVCAAYPLQGSETL